jgi:membrane-associated protease RseP (regulator of RpoE activity)
MKTEPVIASVVWRPPLLVMIATAALLPLAGFAQTPPAPPAKPSGQPAPPAPPEPPDFPQDKRPKVPVTFLGVETSEVPSVVSEQLGLPKGFGLVVDYVVPDGPAAAAGVQQNDILKMFNDQILTEPDQLAKLVRSYSEGTNVTLTILRKGKETKVTAKLAKREVRSRHGLLPNFEKHWNFDQDFGELGREMKEMGRELGDEKQGMIRDAVEKARREVIRAKEKARRAAGQIHVSTTDDNGTVKTTRIDLGKAEIVFSDGQGEMRIDSVAGKKVLTAKDPQGRLLFSGPIETKEDMDKMPAEVRKRFDKLEQKDLPAAAPPAIPKTDEESSDSAGESVDQVSFHRRFWSPGTIRI